jgi:anti-sigma regulatory factor (Ser/Thr protein kinase)
MKPASVTVPASADFVRAAAQFVVQTARHLGAQAAASPLFEVAVVEALANAVKHGSGGREDAVITCEVERTGAGLAIRIYDEGEGFSPEERATPPVDPATAEICDVPASGYGVPIMHSVFQQIEGRREGGRFCLELTLAAQLPLA